MNAPAEPVTVTILDRDYRFSATAEERHSLIEAAHILDQRMREIKNQGKLMALERVAIAAALNFADEALRLRRQQDRHTEVVDSRIRQLADQLDSALSSTID